MMPTIQPQGETPMWRDVPNRTTTADLYRYDPPLHQSLAKQQEPHQNLSTMTLPHRADNGATPQNGRIYSRELEKNELVEAYRRTTRTCHHTSSSRKQCRQEPHEKSGSDTPTAEQAQQQQQTELLLVTGRSGTGKSSLVHSALEQVCVQEDSGFLITAKFDQLERPENYAPIVTAFSNLVGLVKQRSSSTQEIFQKAVSEAIEKQPILIDVIPALQDLLPPLVDEDACSGSDEVLSPPNKNNTLKRELKESPRNASATSQATRRNSNNGNTNNKLCATAAGALGQNTRGRLCFAFETLVEALCSTGYPLVLFCDDLQWAEPASLDLLAAIASDSKLSGFMLVGACRHNEVQTTSHPLSVMLRELESSQVRIRQISLESLDIAAVRLIVSNEYKVDNPSICKKLSDFVVKQTGGNALFVVLLLKMLQEEGFIINQQQHDGQDADQFWEAWERRVHDVFDCSDAVRLVTRRLEQFQKPMQDMLKVAACLGSEFHESLILYGMDGDATSTTINIEEQLKTAERADLIHKVEAGGWRWGHDVMQLAAYSLIPIEERDNFHLALGTKLWKGLPPDQLMCHAIVVISQLRMGAHLITDQDDRNQMASFLLSAAQSAVASSAFSVAMCYIETGISLLGERHWRDEYQLSLALCNAAIEVNYCNGEYEKMDELIDGLVKHARRKDDTYLALSNCAMSWGARGDFRKAIDTGVSLLRDLGFTIPSRPGVLRMLWEHRKTMKALRNLSDEDILNLPPMVDPRKLIAMQLMVSQFTYLINAQPLLGIVMAMKMVQTFLAHGLASVAAPALSYFSLLLCEGFGDVAQGVRYAKLSLAILDKFQSREWLGRTYFGVYGLCFPHVQPWTDSARPMLTAHRVALATGDFEFALHSAAVYMGICLATSMPLEELWCDINIFLALGKTKNQAKVIHFIKPQAQFAANLMGQSVDPTVLTGAIMDEEHEMKDARESNKETNLKILQVCKLRLLSYFHCYEEGLVLAKQLTKTALDDLAVFMKAAIFLHSGLLVAGYARENNANSWQHINFVKNCLKRLRALAKHAATESCCMVLALEAVLAFMKKKYRLAFEKFEYSLVRGSQQGLSDVGVVNEHFARSLLARGRCSESIDSLKNAQKAYSKWGAHAKVADIQLRLNEAGPPSS